MIHNLLDLYRTLTDPDRLIHLLSTLLSGWLGYAALFGVVYSETGLLVGFFLPGDSFLFTVGVVAGLGALNIVAVVLLLMAAAMLGDSTGYLLGRRTGPRIFSRPDSRFFKQAYVKRTHAYYERYGGKTILIARFVPIIRTFAPFVAGIGAMNYSRFILYNIIGGLAWVALCIFSGYLFGTMEIVKNNFSLVVMAIVAISVLPMVIEFLRARRQK